jgi:peptidoglycan DL-endopeptidase CwlO
MSRVGHILTAVGASLALGCVLGAGPAVAATRPSTPAPASTTAKAKPAATRTTTRTRSATTLAAKQTPAKAGATKSVMSASTTTTTTISARPSTAVNVQAIRAAAVAALASRGGPNEPAAQGRLALAVAAAARSATAASLAQAWAHTSAPRLVAMYTALAQVGAPYRSFGMAPDGFDCSGLTWFAWHAAGVNLPRTSAAQNAGLPAGTDFVHALAGDIIWYPGHVELYLGAGRAMVHAKQRGDVIQVEDATKAVLIKRPVG